jgi:hypothetical protein
MADKFYAATRIKYGKDLPHPSGDPTIPDKHETKWFEVGDEVTGLPKDEMQKLWDAGALERREDTSSQRKASTNDSGTTSATGTGKTSSSSETKSDSAGQSDKK